MQNIKALHYELKPPYSGIFSEALYMLFFRAVFARCHARLLLEGAIEGAHGVKTHEVANLCDRLVGFCKILAGV